MKNKRLFSFVTAIIMIFSVCTALPLKISSPLQASAAWSSVSEFMDYALKNWTKPIRADYLDPNGGSRYFGANRSGTNRKHAANDYVCAAGTPVYAMTGGYVEEFSGNFYAGTQAISVKNDDGSVARYCEIGTSLRSGDRVERGQQIGTVIANTSSARSHMLHLELYLGTASGSLSNTSNHTYWYVESKNFCRRQDLLDPTFLQNLKIEPDPPTNVTLSQSQVWYDIKDTVTLYASSDNATSYWISVLKDGVSLINTQISGELSFAASDYGYGDYHAWVTAVNSSGATDSNHVDFLIVGAATYTNVYTSQNHYTLEDVVSISVDTICAKGQVIGIDKIGTGRMITENCDSTYTISASQLGVGEYNAYFTVYNGSGSVDTERVSFAIHDSAPTYSTLEANKTMIAVGEEITFTALSDFGCEYWIGIDYDDSRYITKEMSNGQLTLSFDKTGSYSAYVTSSNSLGGKDSSCIYFTVYDPDKLKGDVNDDGKFTVSDVVLLQKWLLAVPDIELVNWKAADLCEDDRLDVFDLCLMKRMLIEQS